MPDDLSDFYRHFGGAVFHANATYCFRIYPPWLERSDFAVMGEDLGIPDSANWYALGEFGDQVISIDLGQGPQFGYCYDSFWDSYPTADESTLIARSFTELIKKVIESKGERLFWVHESH
ncbi:hypothetical protein RYA05_03160 [Pseudomonas syringae pv. actinidiae]|nr:hypothetical protein [Pseudomonas syringae pv. actinidiae]